MNEQGASTDFLKQCELANKIMRLGQSHITNVHEELWHQDVTKAAALLSSYAQSERNKAPEEIRERLEALDGKYQDWATRTKTKAAEMAYRRCADELAAAIRGEK